MNATSEVPNLQNEWNNLKQKYTGQSAVQGGTRYISRLDCIKEAVTLQIERLAALFPRRRVLVVPFESNVFYLGYDDTQGTFKATPLCKESLFNSSDELVAQGRVFDWEAIPHVGQCKDALSMVRIRCPQLNKLLI